MLAIQSFAAAVAQTPGLYVQDWPFFSSARKGSTVCAHLQIARRTLAQSKPVTEPDIAVLMNEAAADDVRFAEGSRDALYVVNTWHSPQMTAARYRLRGTVVTVAGDDLGQRYLGRPLANIAVLAALVRASELVDPAQARKSLEDRLLKRRLPKRIVESNLLLFDAARDQMLVGEFPSQPHPHKAFDGYGTLPAGARTALRSSLTSHTSG